MAIYLFPFFQSSLLFQKVSKLYEAAESNRCLRIPPPGPLRLSRPAAPSLWALPVHVLGHCAWETTHHSGCHVWPPSPHFHVLLPSLADIDFTSTTILKMILDIQTHRRVISYAGCLTQMSFFMLFGCLDGLLLIVMAYDQFIAICHPLHYLDIMTHVSVARWFWYHFSSVSWFPRCTIPWW